MPKRRSITLFVCFLLAFAAWFGWRSLARVPFYASDHRHDNEEVHEHFHSHESSLSHGHRHVGLVGRVQHSHPHYHDHQHFDSSLALQLDGLTQIGHRHGSTSIDFYWGRAEVDANRLSLKCWMNVDQRLEELRPTKLDFDAKVYLGHQQICELDFKWVDDDLVANLPVDFLHVPTQVLVVPDLKLNGTHFSVSLPLALPSDRH